MEDDDPLVVAIRNDAWMVRYYARNRMRRAQAIAKLGATLRHAFTESDDFETLLAAVLDGLRPQDTHPF
jgi:hypothetical protein